MVCLRKPFNAGIAIGPILFIVAILAVLVGAIASGSGGFGSSTADESARVRAESIIQQALNIKNGFDRIVVDGTDKAAIIVSEATTSPTSRSALYGTGGGLVGMIPPKEAMTSTTQGEGAPYWRFVPDATLIDICAAGANDYIAVLEVNRTTCAAINDILFGRGVYTASTIPVMATTATTVTIAQVATGTDDVIDTGNAFDFDTGYTAALSARTAACVRPDSSTTNYYFYQLLAAG